MERPTTVLNRHWVRRQDQESTGSVGAARHDDPVLFATLAATSADVAATRSRLVKRALLAAAIRSAEALDDRGAELPATQTQVHPASTRPSPTQSQQSPTPPPEPNAVPAEPNAVPAEPNAVPAEPNAAQQDERSNNEPAEIALVVTYLSGTLRQRRTGVGWASLTSIPPPAAESTLTVHDVDAAFEEIAALGGQGSAVLRTAAVEALFARATEAEQHLLRGLVFDEIRQGALDSLVQDGLAEAFGVPAKAVQRASMLLGSTAAAAVVLAADGLAGLEAVSLAVGLPGPSDAGGQRTGRRRRRRQDRAAGRGRHQARRHPGAGAPRRRRDQRLHPQPGRHHRAGTGDRRGRSPRCRSGGWCWTARCSPSARTAGR